MVKPNSKLYSYRLLLAVNLTAIFYLATTPLQVPVTDSINDKIKHIFAFYLLALLMDYSFPAGNLRRKTLALMVYGLAIEITQYFLPYRSCSVFDLGADALGLLFYGLSCPWLARVPFLRRPG